MAYATRCPDCRGYGYFVTQFTQYHEYGSTYAAETLEDIADCPTCHGHPLLPIPDAECHLCTDDIAPDQPTRIDTHGFTVHANCRDRDPGDAPYAEPNCPEEPTDD